MDLTFSPAYQKEIEFMHSTISSSFLNRYKSEALRNHFPNDLVYNGNCLCALEGGGGEWFTEASFGLSWQAFLQQQPLQSFMSREAQKPIKAQKH